MAVVEVNIGQAVVIPTAMAQLSGYNLPAMRQVAIEGALGWMDGRDASGAIIARRAHPISTHRVAGRAVARDARYVIEGSVLTTEVECVSGRVCPFAEEDWWVDDVPRVDEVGLAAFSSIEPARTACSARARECDTQAEAFKHLADLP